MSHAVWPGEDSTGIAQPNPIIYELFRSNYYRSGPVSGSGWGFVKVIWKHGERSSTAPEKQITRRDILAFPQVIRDFEPSRFASADGSRGREWRVRLPNETGLLRTVVFADNLLNGRVGRHLVTVHVQEAGKSGSDSPLSKRKTDVNPESPGLRLESRAGDTAPSVWHSAGQETSVNPNIAHTNPLQKVRELVGALLGGDEVTAKAETKATPKAATPEQARALDLAVRNPDAMIRLEDGSEIRLADLIQLANDMETQAKTDTAAFEAAVNCALRFPQ